MTSPDVRAPRVDPGEVAAACQAAVGVLTALRTGQVVPWTAIVDNGRQFPLIVSALASQLLLVLELEPRDVDEYLRQWGADAAQQAAYVAQQQAAEPPQSATDPIALHVLAPATPEQFHDAWAVVLDALTALRTGLPFDEPAQLDGHDVRHVAFAAVNALHTLLRAIDPNVAQQILDEWRRGLNEGGDHAG